MCFHLVEIRRLLDYSYYKARTSGAYLKLAGPVLPEILKMITETILESLRMPVTCKYCGTDSVVKFGTYRGKQRYWCKSCRKKFKADDTVFHMKVPRSEIAQAVRMFYRGMSCESISIQL